MRGQVDVTTCLLCIGVQEETSWLHLRINTLTSWTSGVSLSYSRVYYLLLKRSTSRHVTKHTKTLFFDIVFIAIQPESYKGLNSSQENVPSNSAPTKFCHFTGSHCHVEAQVSRVTALCWAHTFSLWVLDQPTSSKNRATESLLVGRLDGSLCWLQVTMQEMDLNVKSTELTHCHRKEGEEAAGDYKLNRIYTVYKRRIKTIKTKQTLFYYTLYILYKYIQILAINFSNYYTLDL